MNPLVYFGLGLASVRGARAPAKRSECGSWSKKNRSSFGRSRRYVTSTALPCQWHLLAKVRGLPSAKQSRVRPVKLLQRIVGQRSRRGAKLFANSDLHPKSQEDAPDRDFPRGLRIPTTPCK